MKIVSIVGARPIFIKIIPLVRATQERNKSNYKLKIEHLIIHTGQHYDYEINQFFFDELSIQEPDHNLEVGSGPQGWQTGVMIKKSEEVLITENPN
jgi:UDP-N-acetylglucosamine 2-epimerase (non-hydrolysing)